MTTTSDEGLWLGLGLGAVLLLGSGGGGGGAATPPAEPVVPPRTAPLMAEPTGWQWPIPDITLADDGVRVPPAEPGVRVPATISQAYRAGSHEGVDLDYRRPAGALPSLAVTPVGGGRTLRYRTIDEWIALQPAGWRQRYAAGYLPTQSLGSSSTPGGTTTGDWRDSREGSRAYFCPPNIMCLSVQAGRLWASGETSTGHWVLLDHGTYTTWYGHLAAKIVPPANGGFVAGTKAIINLPRGAALGTVGHDPSAPGTIRHLHLQLAAYPGGVRRVLDPAPSLATASRWIG